MSESGPSRQSRIVSNSSAPCSPLTLDEMIYEDHEVKLLDEALRLMDWTERVSVHKHERGELRLSQSDECNEELD